MLLQAIALLHLLYPIIMPRAKRALEEVDLNAERPAAKSQKKNSQGQEYETSAQEAEPKEVRQSWTTTMFCCTDFAYARSPWIRKIRTSTSA